MHTNQQNARRFEESGRKRDNDEIIANLIIIHAVTTNCAKFFHEVTLNDASTYYQRRKF